MHPSTIPIEENGGWVKNKAHRKINIFVLT
jgi:hypothetical protein